MVLVQQFQQRQSIYLLFDTVTIIDPAKSLKTFMPTTRKHLQHYNTYNAVTFTVHTGSIYNFFHIFTYFYIFTYFWQFKPSNLNQGIVNLTQSITP